MSAQEQLQSREALVGQLRRNGILISAILAAVGRALEGPLEPVEPAEPQWFFIGLGKR